MLRFLHRPYLGVSLLVACSTPQYKTLPIERPPAITPGAGRSPGGGGLHRWTARAGRTRAGRSLANVIKAVQLFLVLSPGAAAQPSVSLSEFWPEFDAFIKLNERSRIFLMYSATKQQNLGAYSDGQAGAYIDFYAVRQLRPHLISYVDPARSKSLMLRAGYSVSRPTGNFISPTEHMVTVEATGRAHLPAGFLLSDRSRVDLRWVAGHPNDRYRNRAEAGKGLSGRTVPADPLRARGILLRFPPKQMDQVALGGRCGVGHHETHRPGRILAAPGYLAFCPSVRQWHRSHIAVLFQIARRRIPRGPPAGFDFDQRFTAIS